MPWKCPQCGVGGIPDSLSSHLVEGGGCGYVHFPSAVIIRSEATGKELSVRVSGSFGSNTLKLLQDEDIKFVSSEQFRIEKREAEGGWLILNEPGAKNPMFLNGNPIRAEGMILKEGDRLSIKDKCLRLTARLSL